MNLEQIEFQAEKILWVLPSTMHKGLFLSFVAQARLLAEVSEVIDRLGPSVTIAALGDDLLSRIREATC